MKGAIGLSFSAVLALLSISFTVTNGKLHPEELFREHTTSYLTFLIAIMTTFFTAVNGTILMEDFPNVGRACNLLALLGVILSYTVLLWVLLPKEFNWIPWPFFAFTVITLIYRHGVHLLRE
ncbi:hypothetical protein NMG60_11009424 [Bertholletia excelsa]